jgi:hypothetical protein
MQPVTPQTAWAPPAPAESRTPDPPSIADQLLLDKITADMRELAKQDEREAFHHSAMIDARVEQMKIRSRIDDYRARLPVEHGGTWRR